MTPEVAFSHPFISKAVNELKCLRTGSQGNNGTAQNQGSGGGAAETRNATGNARGNKLSQQQQS